MTWTLVEGQMCSFGDTASTFCKGVKLCGKPDTETHVIAHVKVDFITSDKLVHVKVSN